MAVSDLLSWARALERVDALVELALREQARAGRVPEGAIAELREAWAEVEASVPPLVRPLPK